MRGRYSRGGAKSRSTHQWAGFAVQFDRTLRLFYKPPAMPITDEMRQFDSRTVRRKIKSGRISEAEYTEFLTELPDVTGNIRARDDGGDDDGYEERIANRGRPREAAAAPAAPAPAASAPAPVAAFGGDDDPFADAPAPTAAARSPIAPPKAPVVPAGAGSLPSPSFDLPPLDPPASPSTPSSGSGDDSE